MSIRRQRFSVLADVCVDGIGTEWMEFQTIALLLALQSHMAKNQLNVAGTQGTQG